MMAVSEQRMEEANYQYGRPQYASRRVVCMGFHRQDGWGMKIILYVNAVVARKLKGRQGHHRLHPGRLESRQYSRIPVQLQNAVRP